MTETHQKVYNSLKNLTTKNSFKSWAIKNVGYKSAFDALDDLIEKRFVIVENDWLLGIAIPRENYLKKGFREWVLNWGSLKV